MPIFSVKKESGGSISTSHSTSIQRPLSSEVTPDTSSANATAPMSQSASNSVNTETNPVGASFKSSVRRIKGKNPLATPSIMSALREDKESGYVQASDHEIVDNRNNGFSSAPVVTPFTETELIEFWKKFVNDVDAPLMKSALNSREPRLLPNWIAEYDLDTELQLNRITLELKPKLLGYLRNGLKNDQIEIQFVVAENLEPLSNTPYTDTEKWNSLAEKYPLLSNLKSKFGLDFEQF